MNQEIGKRQEELVGKLNLFKIAVTILLLFTTFYLYKIAYPKQVSFKYEVVGYNDEEIEDGFTELENRNGDIVSTRRATTGSSYNIEAINEFIIKCPL